MMKWTSGLCRLKRRAPIFFHRAPGILACLRLLAEIAEHRIDRSLQFQIALANDFLHSFPFPVAAQALELLVWIEHESRPGKASRFARTVRVHADDIQRLAAEAERKMRIGRIGRDLRVPVELRCVAFVKSGLVSVTSRFMSSRTLPVTLESPSVTCVCPPNQL